MKTLVRSRPVREKDWSTLNINDLILEIKQICDFKGKSTRHPEFFTKIQNSFAGDLFVTNTEKLLETAYRELELFTSNYKQELILAFEGLCEPSRELNHYLWNTFQIGTIYTEIPAILLILEYRYGYLLELEEGTM